MKRSERLVIENVHKQLGAVKALNGVSMTVRSGTVHGVIGHNGSGKSTLVKVLSGLLRPDAGTFGVAESDSPGKVVRPPRVATVFQDLGLADNLSVFENVLVNSLRHNRFGYVGIRGERARATAALAALGLDIPLDLEVWRLPEPERVMLCVTRALINSGFQLENDTAGAGVSIGVDGVDALLLDEPTSSLPREELERFRLLIRDLRERADVTAVVVTHNPGDIGALCDEFTALRNGEVICTVAAGEVTPPQLAELMAGKALPSQNRGGSGTAWRQRSPDPKAEPHAKQVFVAEAVCGEGLSEPVTFSVDKGEFVGLTGLEGSGFQDFVAVAMGVKEAASGSVRIDGRTVHGGPAALADLGTVYIPADRARTSGVPVATVYENMTLGRVDRFCRLGILNVAAEKSAVTRMLTQLRIDPPDPRRILLEMSGGQQQKVVVGRALLSDAKLLVFEEPTAAVDVGAREEILSYLREVCQRGNTVIVASAEFEWMPTVCDRVLVFRSGYVAGEFTSGEMSEGAILRVAYGD